ncbi:hypothetical protein FOZ61_000490 [Perkinsus olseni]|uniref:Uncharacterized protein n=1 Tax=Perkinsus olseni TaxID=32597 RepID=A0A7J6M112_PEROL|nr:hypothetical protein FOZ61_000490 [Perkinsus olseni]
MFFLPSGRLYAATAASAEFKSQLPRTAHTIYLALLSGHFGGAVSTIVCRSPICKPSQGDKGYPVTFCEMRPITCIPDQLKLHPVAIGHPLFGDYYYTNDRVLDAHYKAGRLFTMPRGLKGPTIQPWLSSPGVWQEHHLRALFPEHTDEAGDSAQWIVRWPSRSTPALPEPQPPPETLDEVVMEDKIGSIVGIPSLEPYESALRHLADIESSVRHWGFIEGDDFELGEIKDPRRAITRAASHLHLEASL